MSCILNLIGENFDIDKFVEISAISTFEKKYKGEQIPGSTSRKRRYSILTLIVSPAGFDDFNKQLEDTIKFLESNSNKLSLIKSFNGLDSASINFGLDSTIDNKTLSQTIFFPKKLVRLCSDLEIEIELSLYAKEMEELLDQANKH